MDESCSCRTGRYPSLQQCLCVLPSKSINPHFCSLLVILLGTQQETLESDPQNCWALTARTETGRTYALNIENVLQCCKLKKKKKKTSPRHSKIFGNVFTSSSYLCLPSVQVGVQYPLTSWRHCENRLFHVCEAPRYNNDDCWRKAPKEVNNSVLRKGFE